MPICAPWARIGSLRIRCAVGAEYRGRGRGESVTTRAIDHGLVAADGSDADAVPIASLAALIEQIGAQRIAMLKMDVEGAEHDVFASAAPESLARIDRLALEYHDYIRPGTLALLREPLTPTHRVSVHPAENRDYGILLAPRCA